MARRAGIGVGLLVAVLLAASLVSIAKTHQPVGTPGSTQETGGVAVPVADGVVLASLARVDDGGADSGLAASQKPSPGEEDMLGHLDAPVHGEVDFITEAHLESYVPITTESVTREYVASVVAPTLEKNELLTPEGIETLVDHAYYTAHWLLEKDHESLKASREMLFPHMPEKWESLDEQDSLEYHAGLIDRYEVEGVGFWKTPITVTRGGFTKHLVEPNMYYERSPESEDFVRGLFEKTGQDADETVFARVDVLMKFSRGYPKYGMYAFFSQLFYYNESLETFTDLTLSISYLQDPLIDVVQYAMEIEPKPADTGL